MSRFGRRSASLLAITPALLAVPAAAHADAPSDAEQNARNYAKQAEHGRDLWQAAQAIYRREYLKKKEALIELQRKAGLPHQALVRIGDSSTSAAEFFYGDEAAQMILQKDVKRLDSEVANAAARLNSSQRNLDSWNRMNADNAQRATEVAKAQEDRDHWAAAKHAYEREQREKNDALDKLQHKGDVKSANVRLGKAGYEFGEKLPDETIGVTGSLKSKIDSAKSMVETDSELISALDQHREAELSLTFDETERNKLAKDIKRLQGDIDFCNEQIARFNKSIEDYSWIANTVKTLAAIQNGTYDPGPGDRGPTTGAANSGGGNSGGSSSGNTREGADPSRTGGEAAGTRAGGQTSGRGGSPQGGANGGGRPQSGPKDRSTPSRPDPKGKGGNMGNGQKGGTGIPWG